MPGRGGLLFSCALHIAVAALFFLHLPFFSEPPPEDTPMVVELVNIAPETHATEKTLTPPTPKAPLKVAQAEPPKPEPPKPTPPPTPPPSPPPPPPPPPEPPPPEPKPPEPKPEPPKPLPPKPEEKPKPPQPQPPQKSQDADFDALLKNLTKRPLTPDHTDKQARPTPQPAQVASSQPIAPLGAQLSTSEIDLVKEQIERCWIVPAGARDAANLIPQFRVYMNPDGTVRTAELLNADRLSDPFFQAASESAKRALLNPACQPLKLPLQKYNLWQTFTITFDPKDLS